MLNDRRGITNVLAVNTGFDTHALMSVLRCEKRSNNKNKKNLTKH